MAEPGEFFGYASLRSDIERLSTPPRIRTRAETLELMRQREKDAMAQQSRNKEQFEYKEAERKKKLKSTIDAWNIAMSKQKKKAPVASPSLSEQSKDAVRAESLRDSDANEKEVAPRLGKFSEKATVLPAESSEMAQNRSQYTLSDEDFRVYRERFRRKFPLFSSPATDEV